jgi:hypothetical protein
MRLALRLAASIALVSLGAAVGVLASVGYLVRAKDGDPYLWAVGLLAIALTAAVTAAAVADLWGDEP